MNTNEKKIERRGSIFNRTLFLLVTVLFFGMFYYPVTTNGQDFNWRKIAKGADTAELYITCYWYDDETTWERWGGVFRSVDNGKTLSVQYKEIMYEGISPARYIYGDSTPGTVYMQYWISRDYGQSWTLKLNPATYGGPFLCSGCNQGEYYFIGNISTGEDCLFHMTNYGDSIQLMNNQIDSFFAIESGSLPGELFSIKYPWGNYFEDTLALAYSNDYGQSFTINFIDSSCVTNLYYYTLTSGPAPGELYLIGLNLNGEFCINHTMDYGNNFTLQHTFPFFLEDYTFVAGRKPGSFYILKTYLAPSLPLHNCVEIYYSSDYGVTFALYFHELDTTYTQIPRPSVDVQSLVCYPNPVGDYLQIKLPSNKEITEITLFDLHGKQQLTTTIIPSKTTSKIDVSTLPSGIYLVKVMQNNQLVGVEKVVIK